MKWTVEWAMKRWPIEFIPKHDNYRDIWQLGDKYITFVEEFREWRTTCRFFSSEQDAVRWLVEGQPRIEKKKWELDREFDIDPAVAGHFPLSFPADGWRFVYTGTVNKVHVKQLRLSAPEKADQ